jgi:hypothetical protein
MDKKMSDTREIDPIFLYPCERNGSYVISIGKSEEYLHTPGENLIASANADLIEHIVTDLQRHSLVAISENNCLEGDPLEQISLYSLTSTQIDFWSDPERSIELEELVQMISGDPIANISPGPEQVDQLHQWRSVISLIEAENVSFHNIQYFIEGKSEVYNLAGLIKSAFDDGEASEKAVFIQLSVLFRSPICAWAFVFRQLSEGKLATALTQSADFVASIDFLATEKIETLRPLGLSEEDSEEFDAANYSKAERLARREVYQEQEHVLKICRQFLQLSSSSSPLKILIFKGESKYLEFKETLSWDVRKEEKAKHIETSVLKTISAFLNTDGGTLLVGVNDDGEILGLEMEIQKLHRGKQDKFLLHFKNLISEKIGAKFYPKLNWDIQLEDKKEVLVVNVQPASEPCFIEDAFYVRTNPSTDQLTGEKQFKYVIERFSPKGTG